MQTAATQLTVLLPRVAKTAKEQLAERIANLRAEREKLMLSQAQAWANANRSDPFAYRVARTHQIAGIADHADARYDDKGRP